MAGRRSRKFSLRSIDAARHLDIFLVCAIAAVLGNRTFLIITGYPQIGNSTLQMTVNRYRGMVARITRGRGTGQERSISANSVTTLTVSSPWSLTPDAGSFFVVAESGWRFGALARSSPVQLAIPNHAGETVQISGRAANVNDLESAAELSTVTRWQIGGSGGVIGGDSAVAPDGLPCRMLLPTAPVAVPVVPPSSVYGSKPLMMRRLTPRPGGKSMSNIPRDVRSNASISAVRWSADSLNFGCHWRSAAVACSRVQYSGRSSL